MSMFEKASRLKIRFPTTKGILTTEDIWDLPLTKRNGVSLDSLAKQLHKHLSENTEISFVEKASEADEVTALQFEIVKHIIELRLKENEEKRTAQATRERNDRIRKLIEEKQDEALKDKSIEELEALLTSKP